jgi:hypothetical protein
VPEVTLTNRGFPTGPSPQQLTNSMPILLNNPVHWHLRAQEARLLAAQLEDPEAKAATLKIADEYERLAVRAAKRLEEMGGQLISPPPETVKPEKS